MSLALLVSLLFVPDEASATKIYGSVISSLSPEAQGGIYVFDSDDAGSFAPVAGAEWIMAQGGGVYADGLYYSINADDNQLTVYDTDTWSVINSMKTSTKSLDMTYDDSDGKIYGCFVSQNAILGTLDTQDGKYKSIGMMRIPPVALMADGKGSLYCIGMDGVLYSVNKANAAMTKIGSTDIYPFSAQSAVIDVKSGKCYWAATRDDLTSGLYEVDLTDGRITLLYDFPGQEEITGLFIIPEASPSAPVAPSGLSADFSGGSASGKVVFTMPLHTVSGSLLDGGLTWTLSANDIIKTGTAMAGQKVDVPIEVSPGMCKFVVSAANGEEEGEKAVLNKWIGYDTPCAPKRVSVEKKSPTDVTVSWDAPSAGVNGGYVALEDIRYDVVRYPGEVPVASDYDKTVFEDKVEAPRLASYRYVVTAKADGKVSAETSSKGVAMGAAKEIPFYEDFASTLSFGTFMVVDGNDDGASWGQDVGGEKVSYPGHGNGNADDWLITLPLALKSGFNYRVKFDVCANTYTPYRVEAMLGSLPNVKDMHTEVVPPRDITQPYQWRTLQANFHVDMAGDYYIGMHVTGAPNFGSLDLDNLSVEILGSSAAPQAPSAFNATAYAKGAHGADITFTAPSKAINGDALAGKCNVELYRGGTLIATFDNVDPGSPIRYSDNGAAAGLNTYKAVSYNSEGVGEDASVDVWVGIDLPGAVTSLVAKEMADGFVEISWEAPETGVHGGYIDASALTYTVKRNGWKEVAKGISDMKAQDVVDNLSGSQLLVSYGVTACSEAGEGETAGSESIMVGTPYRLPFHESFPGGRSTYYDWSTLPLGSLMSWSPSPDGVFASQDGDGGIISVAVYGEDRLGCTLISPKVKIADTVNPMLEFYVAHTAINDELVVEVVADGSDKVELKRIELAGECLEWTKVVVPLGRFKENYYIQLALTSHSVSSEDRIYVDNISVIDDLTDNLAAGVLQCPKMVMAGMEAVVIAPVTNVGSASADGCTVKLYCGDTLLGDAGCGELAPGETAQVEIPFVAGANHAPEICVHAVVEYTADLNVANNGSDIANVAVETSGYPAPSALRGKGVELGVTLEWNSPDLSNIGFAYTKEDFEGYTSFTTTDFGEWMAVEGDPSHDSSMEFSNSDGKWIVFPGDYAWSNYSFTVVDLSQLPNALAADGWDCVSGDKFLMTPYSSAIGSPFGDYVGDYLISPRLKGCAQEITVNAKSLGYNEWGLETIEILASSTDNQLASFKVVDIVENMSTDWTRYRFNLPEGTQYFAIYSKQTATALFLDDISYISENAQADEPEIKGYNVYRDKVRLNSSPLASMSFNDKVADFGKNYEYAVSAVYAAGESALSDPLRINPAGLQVVEPGAPFEVATSPGLISVRNCEGMELVLYTADGKVLAHTTGSSLVTFPVAPGFYVVTVNGHGTKVAVR